MATSSKFDLSSDSMDRPLYASGQRGSHLAAQLDRSGSFRENMENPVLSSLPSMTRTSCAVAQSDVVNFFQCLRFDPKVVAADHKSSRQGDFKRHINIALGVSMDDSPTASSKGKMLPEEIKRVKAGLHESSVKARARMKIFNEALSVFNKFFPSMPSKKRSRSESFSTERPNALLSSDRPILGPGLGKMGIQNHSVPSGFELEQQKSEERNKNAVPNKRTRTSLVDVRGNALVRPPATIDREREMLRLPNSGAVGDDRTLSIGVDAWEKTKMKKKRRSGIKPDVSPNVVVSNKPPDGHREPKQGMQQRPSADARSRLSIDSPGFRPAVANGAVGGGKLDATPQLTGLSVRSSIPRTDLDNSSVLNDRKERPIGSDKERVNLRAVNKANVREDFNSASPTSSTKMNVSIRAPRTGTGIAPKLSPVVHRATAAPNDWELPHCTSKPPANNRKRSASARSSSPPVVHWAGQRPLKNSRTGRRTNLSPVIPNIDESPALDTVSDVSGNEIGLGFARRMTGNSPQQVKLKSDPLTSATLSESEESGPPEIKSKEKGRKCDEVDEKAGQNVQKVSSLSHASRKSKLVSGEDNGDGVRRQGRTGRGFSSTRALMPMGAEKLGNMGTAKQLRSARHGNDKNESKAGRPPTRKLSDRKAYVRQKHTMVNATADFLVGSDDGHEELLAAASAVINPVYALSSSFWKQMEPLFGVISDLDLAFLKQQGDTEKTAPSPTPILSGVSFIGNAHNVYGLAEHGRQVGPTNETHSVEHLPEQFVTGVRDIPLCQRLLAAIISVDDYTHGNGDLEFYGYETGFELDRDLGSNGVNHFDNFQFSEHPAFNGYKVSGKQHDDADIDMLGTSNMVTDSNFKFSINDGIPDQTLVDGMDCSEAHYDSMSLNEKLRLEVESIGIFPQPMPSQIDEEIIGEITKLEEKFNGQVLKKKGLLDKLLRSISEIKELQEKEFEQRALDKLVAMAYEKYMSCWGPSGTGSKSSSSKMAKQAALAFVKRTLERCHKFDETGKSCFSEPLFKDMFVSGSALVSDARSADTPIDGESAKVYANTSNRSLDARVSASMASQPSPRNSRLGQNGDSYAANSSELLPPVNYLSESPTAREDTWSNRVKKRELLLDDVVGGTVGTSSSGPSAMGGSLPSSTKGKRSERERDGKGHSREVSSRNGTTKTGRPAVSSAKGERKSKAKPKQKSTQLSISVNGHLGKIPGQSKTMLPSGAKSNEITTGSNAKEKDGFCLGVLDDSEALDFSSLQLPGIDVLDDGQGQDLGSWLNIDDDGLQDHDDFMGLEIPMDDLSDLNMMV